MPFFPVDEAAKHHSEGLHHVNPSDGEFNLDLALQHLKQAVALKPWNAEYRHDLGHAYLASPLLNVTRGVNVKFKLQRAASLAIPEFQEAIRIRPKYAWSYCWLGLAHEYLGRTQEAVEDYQAVLKLKGRRWSKLKQYVAECLERIEGRKQVATDAVRARKHLEQALRHRDRREFGLAEKEFEEATKLTPSPEWLYRTVCELSSSRL